MLAAVELVIVQLEKDYTAKLGHCSQACEAFGVFTETIVIVAVGLLGGGAYAAVVTVIFLVVFCIMIIIIIVIFFIISAFIVNVHYPYHLHHL